MQLTYWEDPASLNGMFSSTYWNDIEEERKKAWWIDNEKQIDKLRNHLDSTGLMEEFQLCMKHFGDRIHGKVLDLAAGVCWTTALISRLPGVECVDALEFSLHRISDLADRVIDGLEGQRDKIHKIYGSFYNIRSTEPYDTIFLSQAFHHADKPLHLLIACDQALKPGGGIILIGEHLIDWKRYFKAILRRFVKNLVRNYRLILETDFSKLFPPDSILGDHYYRLDDYYFMFNRLGYTVRHVPSTIRGSMIIYAEKPKA